MKTARHIPASLAMTVLLLAASGCDRRIFTVEQFTAVDEISLVIKGSTLLEYSPNTHQLGFSRDRCEFRVSDDNMADYFFLTCNELPSMTGQVIKADLEYTTPDDIKSRPGLELEVTGIDENSGKIWLWNERYQIGIVVMPLN